MKRVASGALPGAPIASHFAMDLLEVGPGTVTFDSWPDGSHYNPIGTVHGGLVCTLLDSALGCATHTTLPAGTGYTSIEIKVNFLRPVTAGSGPLICTGRVTKPGNQGCLRRGRGRGQSGQGRRIRIGKPADLRAPEGLNTWPTISPSTSTTALHAAHGFGAELSKALCGRIFRDCGR